MLSALDEGKNSAEPQFARTNWRPVLTLDEFQRAPELARIFLLRTLSHWIPIGLANYLIFVLVTERFGKSIEMTVVIYSMTGLGGVIATSVLSYDNVERSGFVSQLGRAIRAITDYRLAALALLVWFPVRLGFALPTQFWWTLPAVLLSGVCNSVVAVSTQSLRRKACPNELFPRYLATEILSARLIDWCMGSVAAFVLAKGLVSAQTLYISGAGLFVVAAAMHELASRASEKNRDGAVPNG